MNGQISFLAILVTSLLVISSTVTTVYATTGWITSTNPPQVRHTATNPGSIKICGDHICAPFEKMNKQLQEIQKKSKANRSTYNSTP